MKTTRYFTEQVLRKRPYLTVEMCMRIVESPIHREVQPDGRIRHWGKVDELEARHLRVVTLEDGHDIAQRLP